MDARVKPAHDAECLARASFIRALVPYSVFKQPLANAALPGFLAAPGAP